MILVIMRLAVPAYVRIELLPISCMAMLQMAALSFAIAKSYEVLWIKFQSRIQMERLYMVDFKLFLAVAPGACGIFE